MRRFWLVVVVLSACSGRVPCAQPLDAFCSGDCPTYDSLISPSASADAGCSQASLVVCEGRRSLGIPGYATTRMFFDDGGGLVGVVQVTDVVFEECGAATRTYGQTFDCAGAAEAFVCRATQ